MRHRSAAFACALAVASTGTSGWTSERSPTLVTQFERYARGDHDAVVAELKALDDFQDVLDGLKRDAPAWIAAGPARDRARRELTAATVALEAARAAGNHDWKWVQRTRLGPGAPDAVWWKPPALILEWGCTLVRGSSIPRPVERLWHLAAVSVAQRRADYEFLIGSPWETRGNPEDEIEHLTNAIARFPDEPRFALAQAIAIEWRTWPTQDDRPRAATRQLREAQRAYERMIRDEAIGAEAILRLGFVRLRGRSPAEALDLFTRADEATRDPYVVYLARYFSGQAHRQQNRLGEAERAYRAALATIPGAFSATVGLSTVLYSTDRRVEAASVVDASLSAAPRPVDPWLGYAQADDRFWPLLIARLRAEVRR